MNQEQKEVYERLRAEILNGTRRFERGGMPIKMWADLEGAGVG